MGRGLLCRHVLILGETGSGKTASGVLPAVGTMFDRRNPFGCALVVDPKRETDGALDALRRTGGAEVRVFEPRSEPGGPTLNVMAGPRWPVEADVEEGRSLTAAHRILVRTSALSTMSPGAFLAGNPTGRHHDIYWPAEGGGWAGPSWRWRGAWFGRFSKRTQPMAGPSSPPRRPMANPCWPRKAA